MIIAGDINMFAVEAIITGVPNGWLLGSFKFVLHGQSCGNWDDVVDLRGCYGWLKDFAENPRQRFEAGLLDLQAAAVFKRLVYPVLNPTDQIGIPEFYKNTFSRFHISHLGMSSFDHVVMVLIESDELQRCVWEEGGVIHDDVFPSSHMQHITSDFCKLLEHEASSHDIKLKS